MNVCIRGITAADTGALRHLLRSVSVFEPHEISVAEELLAEALSGNPDYVIHVAEGSRDVSDISAARGIVGYVCHGHNPVTDALYDLYWIAVDPAAQGLGIGRALITHAENGVRDKGGRGIVIETSTRPEYASARRLYEKCGYRKAAEVPDFYKPGDGLLIYLKFM